MCVLNKTDTGISEGISETKLSIYVCSVRVFLVKCERNSGKMAWVSKNIKAYRVLVEGTNKSQVTLDIVFC